jgi:thioredoxin family protein
MIAGLWIAVLVLTALMIGLALVVSGLVQAMNELRSVDAAIASIRPKGLPPGSIAPPVTGAVVGGGRFDPMSMAGRAHVVAFVSPECEPCRPLIEDLADAGAVRDLPPAVMVTRGSSAGDAVFAVLAGRDDVTVVVQEHDEVADRYQTHATPHVFVVDEEGIIVAQGVANDARAVRALASHQVARR